MRIRHSPHHIHRSNSSEYAHKRQQVTREFLYKVQTIVWKYGTWQYGSMGHGSMVWWLQTGVLVVRRWRHVGEISRVVLALSALVQMSCPSNRIASSYVCRLKCFDVC